jgi:molybdopterin converting factor subunit 1
MAVAIAVRARYFARLRELAGVENEVVHVSVGATLGDAYSAAREKHPALPEREGVRGAVNQEFAGWDSKIANGDEIAYIPPVSGGGIPCATT